MGLEDVAELLGSQPGVQAVPLYTLPHVGLPMMRCLLRHALALAQVFVIANFDRDVVLKVRAGAAAAVAAAAGQGSVTDRRASGGIPGLVRPSDAIREARCACTRAHKHTNRVACPSTPPLAPAQGSGGGHHSPVVAFHEGSDSVLILDVGVCK